MMYSQREDPWNIYKIEIFIYGNKCKKCNLVTPSFYDSLNDFQSTLFTVSNLNVRPNRLIGSETKKKYDRITGKFDLFVLTSVF